MSRLEVLVPGSAHDFVEYSSDEAVVLTQEDGYSNVVANNMSTSPTPISSIREDHDIHIPNLPPLLRGHPDIHLRNGVMRASRLSAMHEPDAEKAFFVADLSYVLRQHDRWMKCLPEIKPFYGECLLYCSVRRKRE